jgi:hypothetical protein
LVNLVVASVKWHKSAWLVGSYYIFKKIKNENHKGENEIKCKKL